MNSSFQKKGKLITCTITNRFNKDLAPIQLLCVGKPLGKTYFRWWKHVPQLAPSPELVDYTNRHRKGNPNWWDDYVPKLLQEWSDSKDFKVYLRKYVINNLNDGKDVAVACYCNRISREVCHLSVLSDIVTSMGYESVEAEEV